MQRRILVRRTEELDHSPAWMAIILDDQGRVLVGPDDAPTAASPIEAIGKVVVSRPELFLNIEVDIEAPPKAPKAEPEPPFGHGIEQEE